MPTNMTSTVVRCVKYIIYCANYKTELLFSLLDVVVVVMMVVFMFVVWVVVVVRFVVGIAFGIVVGVQSAMGMTTI